MLSLESFNWACRLNVMHKLLPPPPPPPPPQIPEYCHSLDEPDVLDNAFELIFAFDEIVALGYRENVNLAQIRTFTEMDSHEEKVYEAMRRVSSVFLSPLSFSSLFLSFLHSSTHLVSRLYFS
jgi:hypothetical protein